MWILDQDTNKWTPTTDSLNISDFESLKQDLKSMRFYQKCLSGSTYVATNDLSNIYDIITEYNPRTFSYSPTFSSYIVSYTGSIADEYLISTTQSQYELLHKFLPEYGLTMKNLFTPNRLINDQLKNLLYVDVASTEHIINIDSENPDLTIDGTKIKNGHRILLKNQYRYETIDSSITDPDTYFEGYYELSDVIGTSSTYRIPNSDNGVYVYQNNKLQRSEDLEEYEDTIKYAICVKLGTENRELEFNLQRLNNGYFPEYKNGETMYFKERHNWVLRNRVDYNNLYELSLKDTIRQSPQSISVDGISYSIPQRSVVVGEFGSIIVDQSGTTNIINSKYKNTIRSVSSTSTHYWACGDDGIVLKIAKSDLSIERIVLKEETIDPIGSSGNPTINQSSGNVNTQLNCISFFNDLRGIIVGKFNQIWITNNSGFTWKRINFTEFAGFNFNKILFREISKFYVAGDSGIFIEFVEDSGNWGAYKRRISKLDGNDEYRLVDDIIDIDIFTDSSGLLSANSEFISIGAKNNNLYLYDLNKSFSQHDFLFLGENNNFGDITSVSYLGITSSIVFSTYDRIYSVYPFSSTFSSTSSNILTSAYSIYSTQSGINKISKFESKLILAGHNSIWSELSITQSSIYDSGFFSRLKPRLLFMDYDIGSKLYWFDDLGQYRLPNEYTIPTGYLVGSGTTASGISFSQALNYFYTSSTSTASYVETNWITYWKDRMKTFEYYSQIDNAHKIEPSFEFRGSDQLGISFTYSSSQITTQYSDISNLMPATQSSRFRSLSGTVSSPSATYSLYFYDYLGIWAVTIPNSAYPPKTGDVIMIDSDIVYGRFIINKIFKTTSGSNTTYYQYFYTNFNENILNNLPSISGYVEVKNLNKYPMTATYSLERFIDNFNNHYISYGYDIGTSSVGATVSFDITGKYTQFSAYYNLQCKVSSTSINGTSSELNMMYPSGFLNFGYTPNYNLLSYLNYIDRSKYTPSKEFLVLPKYVNIPGPDAYPTIQNEDLIYIDVTFPTNKLIFGKNIKHIWESLMQWTFVDLNINEGAPGVYPPSPITGSSSTNRLLIIDKYHEVTDDTYIIEFHDEITGYSPSTDIVSFDIRSRRTLSEISGDLQYINRLHRPQWSVSSIQSGMTFSNYETDINFKIPTDSYTKALLSDSDVVRDITGIIYTDHKYELAMQITKLDREYELEVSGAGISANSKYEISFADKHQIRDKDYVIINLTGTVSNHPEMIGYHSANYVDDYTIEIDVPFISFTPPDLLSCSFVRKDNFLNFQPIDIFDLGVQDKKVKQSIEILSENYDLSENKYYLKDIDFKKYRFRLIDGLDLDILSSKFGWILEAEISGAVIGMDINQNLIWYKGTWECGRWFGGRWVSGIWKSGDWYEGTWDSRFITDNLLSVRIDNLTSNTVNSVWLGGRWFDGTWNNGTWYDGRWYDGIWNNGTWYDGTWNDGTWNNGEFTGGIWILGNWINGIFNTNTRLSYWLDGKFLGGDFENGIWYNGEFNQKNGKISRFGTKSFNSRNSVWYGGKFLSGQFHSYLNTNDEGNPDVSDIHKYSIWHTGLFSGGDFYGGTSLNINFNSGVWHGGISKDINIIGINSTSSNTMILDGIYRFNINDEFFVVDNMITSSYSVFGSIDSPTRYKVLDVIEIDEDQQTTEVYVDIKLSNILSVDTGLTQTGIYAVSHFSDSIWNSGIWINGVFNGGNFNGGIWYQGVFSGIWG